MPPTTGWDNGKLARVKEVTKTLLRRFGPILITGLAAAAEHHWLGHDDEPAETRGRESSNEAEEPSGEQSIRQLEREVKELKRSLSRRARDAIPSAPPPSPRIREEIVREWRPPYLEDQARETYPRGRALSGDRPGPGSSPYQDPPNSQPLLISRPEAPLQYVQTQERDYVRPSHRRHSIRRRRRRHRLSSVPHRSRPEHEFSGEAIHAGKVAVIAGAVETIHMDDVPGDWIGPKGLRVGTTMAATYAASRSRDRDPDDFRRREVVADVGTGVLVSRLVHGSSRRLEEQGRRGRRWSYCY